MRDSSTFGGFIAEKRLARGITLRSMAEMLNMSPGYYCDIEKGRRTPPDRELLDSLAEYLTLGAEDQITLLDLAAKSRDGVSLDLPKYIMDNEVVRVALRLAKESATEDDWRGFIKTLERKKE